MPRQSFERPVEVSAAHISATHRFLHVLFERPSARLQNLGRFLVQRVLWIRLLSKQIQPINWCMFDWQVLTFVPLPMPALNRDGVRRVQYTYLTVSVSLYSAKTHHTKLIQGGLKSLVNITNAWQTCSKLGYKFESDIIGKCKKLGFMWCF